MSRTYFIPGIVFLFTAFILSFLVSLSLPAVDVVRVDFGSSVGHGKLLVQQFVEELRLGVWNYCVYYSGNVRSCGSKEAGYSVPEIVDDRDSADNFVISSAWTRRLVVHPIGMRVASMVIILLTAYRLFVMPTATVFTFLAFTLSLLTYCPITRRLAPSIPPHAGRAAPFLCSLAAVLTLVALSMDITLFSLVKDAIDDFGDDQYQPATGTAFWLTLASLVLTIVGGGCIFFARHTGTTNTRSRQIFLPRWANINWSESVVQKS